MVSVLRQLALAKPYQILYKRSNRSSKCCRRHSSRNCSIYSTRCNCSSSSNRGKYSSSSSSNNRAYKCPLQWRESNTTHKKTQPRNQQQRKSNHQVLFHGLHSKMWKSWTHLKWQILVTATKYRRKCNHSLNTFLDNHQLPYPFRWIKLLCLRRLSHIRKHKHPVHHVISRIHYSQLLLRPSQATWQGH